MTWCHADLVAPLNRALGHSVVLLCSSWGVLSCDAHAVAELDETAAGPEGVAIAPDTLYRLSRLVRHVHHTALEHRQRLGLATEAVVDDVPRRVVHDVEHVEVPA